MKDKKKIKKKSNNLFLPAASLSLQFENIWILLATLNVCEKKKEKTDYKRALKAARAGGPINRV